MEFSDLAIAKLLQVFPELAQYIVTFKDVTEDIGRDSEDLKVGIFILNVGGSNIYVPILSRNQVIQPIDSAFNPQDQAFIPLTKAYVDTIIASNTTMGTNVKMPSTVNRNPSVYDLVVPPRTGKFAYASSRLPEFLAMSPGHVKQALSDIISSDRDVAQGLNSMFDLKELVSILRQRETSPAPAPNTEQELQVLTGGDNLSHNEIQDVLNKGYALRGIQKEVRIAVPAWDFSKAGALSKLSNNDSGLDYNIVLKSGETRHGTLLKISKNSPQSHKAALSSRQDGPFILYSNGDYSQSTSTIATGMGKDGKEVFSTLFQYVKPSTPVDVIRGNTYLVLSPDLEYVTVIRASKVERSSVGVMISDYDLTINAFNNCPRINAQDRKNLYVPINTLFVLLGNNITEELEVNENSAQMKLEMTTLMTLGGMSSIGFDGIDYTYNGKQVHSTPKLMEILVVHEGIAPTQAENFVKQAQENKVCKFYLSKKADFEPAEIPQFGDAPAPQAQSFGPDSSFVPTLKDSFVAQDPQTTEAAILSELLQAQDMGDYIDQYLPEIEAGLDKLGRVLFLMRINSSQMFTGDNASEIFSFVASLRNVYRQLGDNVIKLKRTRNLVTSHEQISQQ